MLVTRRAAMALVASFISNCKHLRVRWTASLLVVMSVGLGACSEGSPSLATGYTSEREEQYANDNPEYAERLRLSARLAKQVNTDSLRSLYLHLLDAEFSQRPALWHEMLCETSGQMMRYSPAVALRAQQHLEDSLLALPGVPERWASTKVAPAHTMTTAGCRDSVPSAPDSLAKLPSPNVLR